MKRPWQIWTLFLLCLAVTAPAMAYLSLKSLELDRAEALARRQAALDEEVNLALWRMDTLLMPLLAQEATRPPRDFQPFHPSPQPAGKEIPGNVVPSPLLRRPSELVRLHFQATAEQWTSPQAPQAELRELALSHGVEPSSLSENEVLLRELQANVDFETLLLHMPAKMLPVADSETLAWTDASGEQPLANRSIVTNAYGFGSAQKHEPPFLDAPPPKDPYGPAQSPPVEPRQQRGGKGENDLFLRDRAYQVIAQQQSVGQRANTILAAPPSVPVREGVSRALWIGGKLILARRVQIGPELRIQGCWLDWSAIESRLRQEVADLRPDFRLAPMTNGGDIPPSRMLATLPVQVVVAKVEPERRSWSPIRLSLVMAWTCLGVATLAMAVLLAGVVSLSERRAAFVAAVTHELRTPLTTFRMYSEMLAQGMAPPEKRQEYLTTLQSEADRLTHLVENVLAYARLERGRLGGRRINISLGDLLAEWTPPLADRAAQANLELITDAKECANLTVITDPHAVGQILFNLVDNAAKYAAGAKDRRIELSCRVAGKIAQLRVRDYGPGLSQSQQKRLFRPFSKTVQEAAVTAPGVGLGLALCCRLAKAVGGKLTVAATDGPGAEFVLELPLGPVRESTS